MRESLLRRRPPSMNLNSEAKLETLVGSLRFFWALLPRSLRSRGQIIFSRLSPPSAAPPRQISQTIGRKDCLFRSTPKCQNVLLDYLKHVKSFSKCQCSAIWHLVNPARKGFRSDHISSCSVNEDFWGLLQKIGRLQE